MAAATYKKVNDAIAKYGVMLVKGNGYHYFSDIGDEYVCSKIRSVYDGGFLRSMTLEQWIDYVDSEVNK